MKIFPLAWLVLFCTISCLTAETVSNAAPATHILFQVLAAESLQMGQILDREQRDFSFCLKNIQVTPLKLQRVRVNCPCLQILEAPQDIQLLPGGECLVRGRLDAGKLSAGKFSRLILLEFSGFEPQPVFVSGESVSMLEIEPGSILDFGTFAGVEVFWTRKVRIRSRFTAEKPLELLEPVADRYFEYELHRLDASEYELTVRPKLPLPQGILRHTMQIPTRGIDRYGPVEFRISGTVTGWALAVRGRILPVDLKQKQADGGYSGEVKIIAEEGGAVQGRRRVVDAQKEKSSSSFRPVSEDEKAASLLTKLETWQKISSEIEVALPEMVSLEKIAQSDGIVMQFKFPAEFFRGDSPSSLSIHYRDRKLAVLNIVGRE